MKKGKYNRVLQRLILIIIISVWAQGITYAQVPSINKIEYFIDNDPGYGKAINLSFTGTTDATATITIDMLPLAQGVHIVGVRSRDTKGAWSLDNKWIFLKPYTNNGVVVQPNINRVEWFLDNDPGYGNGTPITINAAQNIANLSFSIGLTPLTQGVHIVGVRSRDVNGAWSLDNKWIFLKPYANSGAVTQPNITRVEWYINDDPGYGKATPITINPGQDLTNLSLTIDMVPLRQGVHIVGIRSRDANGAWSLDNKWIFLKPYTTANGNVQPNIVKTEYYIDVDPGYGKATSVTIAPGKDVSGVIFTADLSVVPNGAHKMGIRSMDTNGAWSLDNQWSFTGGTAVGYYWTGLVSTSWTNTGNWSTGTVPTINDAIIIPSGTPFSPVIANGITGTCKSITINSSAIMTVATGGNLKVGP